MCEVTGASMPSLWDGRWLNDEIINSYMWMILQRSKRNAANVASQLSTATAAAAATPPTTSSDGPANAAGDTRLRLRGTTPPRIHVYGSGFFTRALTSNGYDYELVRRWSFRAGVDIWGLDMLIVPVHAHSNHWTLSVVDFRKKTISYYDSKYGHNSAILQTLRQYLIDEARTYRKQSVTMDGWQYLYPTDIPYQDNACDCGVFTMMMADYLSEDLPITGAFEEREMKYFRRRVALDIYRKFIL